jgi:hypothetical protein
MRAAPALIAVPIALCPFALGTRLLGPRLLGLLRPPLRTLRARLRRTLGLR